jgi:hypothetical protein
MGIQYKSTTKIKKRVYIYIYIVDGGVFNKNVYYYTSIVGWNVLRLFI